MGQARNVFEALNIGIALRARSNSWPSTPGAMAFSRPWIAVSKVCDNVSAGTDLHEVNPTVIMVIAGQLSFLISDRKSFDLPCDSYGKSISPSVILMVVQVVEPGPGAAAVLVVKVPNNPPSLEVLGVAAVAVVCLSWAAPFGD